MCVQGFLYINECYVVFNANEYRPPDLPTMSVRVSVYFNWLGVFNVVVSLIAGTVIMSYYVVRASCLSSS